MTPAQLVALPWAWRGPTRERDDYGSEWFEIRIAELDEFFVAAGTPEEAVAQASPALEAFLDSYLSQGERPPLPAVFEGAELPEPFTRVRGLQVAQPALVGSIAADFTG
jgi:predicted RNase H-like HicB family nuclease